VLSFLRQVQTEAGNAAKLARLISLRARTTAKLNVQDFKNFGQASAIPPIYLHAFFFVESANSGFTADGRLTINCEPHVRYRNSSKGRQLYRQAPDLFYPRWINERNTPKGDFHVYRLNQLERWDNLARACILDFDAAVMGTSFGAGQQLGEMWRELGFNSVMDLIEHLYQGQGAQLDVMVRCIRVKGQLENLRIGNLRPVIAAYNGEGNVPVYLAKFQNAVQQKQVLYA
jgi:hypothetical protein